MVVQRIAADGKEVERPPLPRRRWRGCERRESEGFEHGSNLILTHSAQLLPGLRPAVCRVSLIPIAQSKLLHALVDDGLVTREPHPGDRRATLVTFTARGETLVAQLKRDHKALARALFAPMSRSELDRFRCGLGGVIDRLRAHLGAKAPESQDARL
jgi:hypothetical protein